MKTLKTLRELQETEQLDSGIEYNEGSALDDLFVEMLIVSPHNKQKLQYAWVPVDMEQELQDEKDLADTNSYYDWTSTWTSFRAKFEDEEFLEEDLEKKKDIVEEWNNTPLGSRYPISVDDIDYDIGNTNRIFFTKKFALY